MFAALPTRSIACHGNFMPADIMIAEGGSIAF